jgi:hypothetical protein
MHFSKFWLHFSCVRTLYWNVCELNIIHVCTCSQYDYWLTHSLLTHTCSLTVKGLMRVMHFQFLYFVWRAICVVRKVFCFAWMFMLCSGSKSSEIILFIHIYYYILASCKQLNKLTDIFLDKFGKHKIYDLSYFMLLWMYFEWAKQNLLLEVHYSYIRTKWF